MPIEVRSTIEGDTDYDHYCSLPCLLAARVSVAGVAKKDGCGGWQHLAVTIDGRYAVDAIKAMGGEVSELSPSSAACSASGRTRRSIGSTPIAAVTGWCRCAWASAWRRCCCRCSCGCFVDDLSGVTKRTFGLRDSNALGYLIRDLVNDCWRCPYCRGVVITEAEVSAAPSMEGLSFLVAAAERRHKQEAHPELVRMPRRS